MGLFSSEEQALKDELSLTFRSLQFSFLPCTVHRHRVQETFCMSCVWAKKSHTDALNVHNHLLPFHKSNDMVELFFWRLAGSLEQTWNRGRASGPPNTWSLLAAKIDELQALPLPACRGWTCLAWKWSCSQCLGTMVFWSSHIFLFYQKRRWAHSKAARSWKQRTEFQPLQWLLWECCWYLTQALYVRNSCQNRDKMFIQA